MMRDSPDRIVLIATAGPPRPDILCDGATGAGAEDRRIAGQTSEEAPYSTPPAPAGILTAPGRCPKKLLMQLAKRNTLMLSKFFWATTFSKAAQILTTVPLQAGHHVFKSCANINPGATPGETPWYTHTPTYAPRRNFIATYQLLPCGPNSSTPCRLSMAAFQRNLCLLPRGRVSLRRFTLTRDIVRLFLYVSASALRTTTTERVHACADTQVVTWSVVLRLCGG
eukprot:gene9509-biopygen22732